VEFKIFDHIEKFRAFRENESADATSKDRPLPAVE
jgi:hypothetical protein